MKKSIKVYLSAILVATLLFSNVSAFAATKPTRISSEQQINTANNIASLETELKAKGTDVILELNKLTTDYDVILKTTSSLEEHDKIQRLITTTKQLIQDYSLYKQFQSKDFLKGVNSVPTLSAEVAVVIAYFSANGYKLSAELLTHARDNNVVDSTYYPEYGYICNESPAIGAIWAKKDFNGSSIFSKNAFSSKDAKDLYYSIKHFDWVKHLSLDGNSYLEIKDRYDFDNKSEHTGVAGVAVEVMYQAQEAGVIVPFQVRINLYK